MLSRFFNFYLKNKKQLTSALCLINQKHPNISTFRKKKIEIKIEWINHLFLPPNCVACFSINPTNESPVSSSIIQHGIHEIYSCTCSDFEFDTVPHVIARRLSLKFSLTCHISSMFILNYFVFCSSTLWEFIIFFSFFLFCPNPTSQNTKWLASRLKILARPKCVTTS